MSASMQHGRNRSRSPDDYSKRSLLSKVDRRDFHKLRVAIKRSGIGQDGPDLPLERDIEDYRQISLLVHVRRGAPPRVPVFSGDIKVNQDFSEDRTVFTHDRARRSRSISKYRSRSRSRDKYRRRSKERDRDRSRSRSRRESKSSHRSKSRDRKRYRHDSREKSRRSRSRSSGSRSKRPAKKSYDSYERKRRSITPLRPGEYRPGHPDLALRKQRKVSRSRSRSPSHSNSRERSVRHRSPTVPVPMMEYDFYEGYGQFGPMAPMAPYRPVHPGFYPRMYAPPMMMPRMPMPGYPLPRMPPMFRQRLPVYNTRKTATTKTATVITVSSHESEGTVEQPSDEPERENSMEISSSNRKCESETGASEAVTV